MRIVTTSFALVLTASLLALPAWAQDGEGTEPAAPAEGADAAEGPERRVDADAEKRVTEWGNKMHLPVHSEANKITAKGAADAGVLIGTQFEGEAITIQPEWNRGGGLALGIDMPQAVKDAIPAEMLALTNSMLDSIAGETLSPLFVSPGQYVKQYHVDKAKGAEDKAVELTAFVDDTFTERQTLFFDERGLVERRMMVLRVDPTDPAMQMFVGYELETTYVYEQKGERFVVAESNTLTPIGDVQVTFEYWDIPEAFQFPKKATLVTPFTMAPVEILFDTFSVDGKVLESTKPADAAAETGSDGEDGADGTDATESGSEE